MGYRNISKIILDVQDLKMFEKDEENADDYILGFLKMTFWKEDYIFAFEILKKYFLYRKACPKKIIEVLKKFVDYLLLIKDNSNFGEMINKYMASLSEVLPLVAEIVNDPKMYDFIRNNFKNSENFGSTSTNRTIRMKTDVFVYSK